MLVAEGYLEVVHLLAVALKPKVSRLYDPRVHRAHAHLVNLLPLNPVKFPAAGDNLGARGPVPGVLTRPGPNVAHGLEPGMAYRLEAELFGHLPLEQLRLGKAGGEGRKRASLDR